MNRFAVAAVLVALLVGLGIALAVTVPWTVLPGAHPVVDVARDFTPAQVAREQAYHGAVRPPAYTSLVVGLVLAGVLGLTPLGARLVGLVRAGWVVQTVVGVLVLMAVGRLVTLPFDARAEAAARRYGLSRQTWGSWSVDQLKGLLVGWLLTTMVVLFAIGLARIAPRTWWAWAAGVTAALVVAGSFAYPVLVEPVFNSFTPLPAGQLRTDLLALAERDRVPVKDVLVADASKRTSSLNAYVSGFGSTRRIVLYDTLVATSTPQEVELIVAHELGHAKRQDVLHGTLLGALGSAAGVCVLALLLSWSPLLRRAGADGPGDPRVLALVLFLVAAGTLLLAPGTNLVSRRIEARADVHSLQLTCDVPTFVASFRRLAVTNLSDLTPNPVLYTLFSTHPSAPQRIALARAYQGRCR